MRDADERFQFIADKGDARLRLDRILVRRVTDVSRMSRTVAQQWIQRGAVEVDDAPATRPSIRVREGSMISVAIPAEAPRRVRPAAEESALTVLYEDPFLLVADKPPGIVVHPSYKQLSGTLLNAVLWRLRDNPTLQPGIVTRLDKDTSGLVLVALTPEVHASFQRDAAAGRLRKRYLAVVSGVPGSRTGRIELPLARDPDDRRRMVVAAGGAASDTRYEVLSEHEISGHRASLLACTLVTGRTHQIRVHLAASGWPIVGDRTYGAAHPDIGRQALHAWTLSLRHPVTREALEFESRLPPDLQALLGSHGTMPSSVGDAHTVTRETRE